MLALNEGTGSPGLLYLIQDTTLVTNAQKAAARFLRRENQVRLRWKRLSRPDIVRML